MIAEQNRRPNGFTQMNVYVDANDRGEIAGRAYFPRTGQEAAFASLLELLAVYEQWMDTENFPQKTHALRQFQKGGRQREMSLQEKCTASAEKPTFVIQVQYRQNASWQGTVSWIEGEKIAHFRSALELIRLMDEVVGQDEPNSWKETQQAFGEREE